MIGAILKLMLTRWITIKRWSNYPRVEYTSQMDNTGFVLHIALFLWYLEEKDGNTIDKEFLIKRIIFDSFKWLILSDINAGTREYIKQIDSAMFDKVEQKALSKILALETIPQVKEDIEKTILNTENKREIDIIAAARKYAWFLECSVNHKIFSEVYEVPLSQIVVDLEKSRKEVKSLDTLLKNENYKKYLLNIRRLSHAMRWNWEARIIPISVMSHLVIVGFISYIIATIENESWANVNVLDLLMRWIYHDIPEAITGDIINPTKTSVEGFPEVLEIVEQKMLDDYLFSFIPEDYKTQIFPLVFHPFGWDNGKIVKYADIISALFEARTEVLSGNIREFDDICISIQKKLAKVEMKSVNYILTNTFVEFSEKHKLV